jgi:hypothetical protein
MEWLAFEIQHAEQHAQSHAVEDDKRKGHVPAQHQDPTARSPGYLSSQTPFSLNSDYLQMYQPNRLLKLHDTPNEISSRVVGQETTLEYQIRMP